MAGIRIESALDNCAVTEVQRIKLLDTERILCRSSDFAELCRRKTIVRNPGEIDGSEIFSGNHSSGNQYLDHLMRANDIFYDQVKISDQKAAYILTFMLAFLVSSTEGRSVFTIERYEQGVSIKVLCSVSLALASIFSIFCAILVILPRHVDKPTSLFWGTWPAQRDAFRTAASKGDPDYLFEQYMTNADALAFIAKGKYRCVKLAFRALLVTVLSYVLLLVASG